MSETGIMAPPPVAQSREAKVAPPAYEATGFGGVTELSLGATPPPKPLPAILVALQQIPPGVPQHVRSMRRPTDLVAALRQRGIIVTEQALPDGTWRMIVISPNR